RGTPLPSPPSTRRRTASSRPTRSRRTSSSASPASSAAMCAGRPNSGNRSRRGSARLVTRTRTPSRPPRPGPGPGPAIPDPALRPGPRSPSPCARALPGPAQSFAEERRAPVPPLGPGQEDEVALPDLRGETVARPAQPVVVLVRDTVAAEHLDDRVALAGRDAIRLADDVGAAGDEQRREPHVPGP